MKTKTPLLAILFFALLLGCEKTNDAHSSDDPTASNTRSGLPFLDLTIDQEVAGGLDQATIDNMKANGWDLATFDEDVAVQVRFKDPGGNLYFQDGMVAEGETIMLHAGNEEGMLAACGNKCDDWETVSEDTCKWIRFYDVTTIHP